MQSIFNQEDFLNTVIDTGGEKISERPPFVPDCECQGQIVAIFGRAFQQRESNLWRLTVDVTWSVMDRSILDEMKVSEARVRQTLWVTPEREDWAPTPGQSFSFNVRNNPHTGRLLSAIGMNPPPKGFKFPAIIHSTAWLRVREPALDDQQATMSNVVRVASTQAGLSGGRS